MNGPTKIGGLAGKPLPKRGSDLDIHAVKIIQQIVRKGSYQRYKAFCFVASDAASG
jgi:hypothetical protein